jgi:hypothetical protein
MPYKATGRPVGRPKTKDYQTISLKIPTTLLTSVKRYARQHRQTVSELIRDGLEWRIGEGDPRGLGLAMPPQTAPDDHEYYGNTETSAEVLAEIRTALARQEAQLQALAQALESQPAVSPPEMYSGNTAKVSTGQQSTLALAPEGDGRHAPPEIHAESSNTVLQEDVPPFDPNRFVLGPLCQKRHDYDGQGHSLRQIGGKHECVECTRARKRAYKGRQREQGRQAQPA